MGRPNFDCPIVANAIKEISKEEALAGAEDKVQKAEYVLTLAKENRDRLSIELQNNT